MSKNSILDFVKTMREKDHAILFYAGRSDKREILFTYLKAGLESGEAALYVASDETTDEIAKAMLEFGLDVEHYRSSRALKIVDYRDWYIIKGEFDISRVISFWQDAQREAVGKGFTGLRVVGEMSCFFRNHMLNELVIYERALHRDLTVPMKGICAYDDSIVLKGIEDTRYLRLYLDLIAAHGTILFVGPEEAGLVRNA